jgi:uncharacterized delta-60 repeat protein
MRLPALALCLVAPLACASGRLDPRFDGDGKLDFSVAPDTQERIRGGLLDGAGRHVAVGDVSGEGYVAASVIRRLSDGRPDPAFASNGLLLLASPDAARDSFSLSHVAEQPDGKLVLLGTASAPGSRRAYACRLLPDGSIDESFGNFGCEALEFWFDSPTEQGIDLALQDDGKLVIVGLTYFDGEPAEDYAVARLHPDGSLDRCFGDVDCSVGGVLLQPGQPQDLLTPYFKLALDPLGRILLADDDESDMLVIRLLPDGEVDTGFGKEGHAVVPFDVGGNGFDRVIDVAALPDGGIVLVGAAETADGELVAIAKLDADGDTDPGFDGDGRVVTFFNDVAPDQSGQRIVIQDDGKLLVAGTAGLSGGQSDCGLLRLRADGSLDPVFGLDGRVSLDGGAADDPPRPDRCGAGLAAREGAIALFGNRDTAPANSDGLLLRFEQDDVFRDGFEGD